MNLLTMESKYYTPDISELYVGFECEDKTTPNWPRRIIEDPEYMSILGFKTRVVSNSGEVTYNLENKIRVKYLDKSDIESFGFEYITNNNPETVIFSEQESNYEFDKYSLHKKYYSINLYLKREGHKYNLLYGYNDNELIGFTIKNKSELKKLLQQLNIL